MTSKLFKYNTGAHIEGTEQLGDIAVATASVDVSTGGWISGPDEQSRYITAQVLDEPRLARPVSEPASDVTTNIAFLGTNTESEQEFLDLVNYIRRLKSLSEVGSYGAAVSACADMGIWTNGIYIAPSLPMIGASSNHSLYLEYVNNQVWGWGYNYYGQLGNNDVICKITPVSILGAKKTFCSIAGGNSHSLGIDHIGQVWGWGWNLYGQLGYNDTTHRCTPVSIHGAKKTFCSISGGNPHSLGIDFRGQVWGWGHNYYGQLGDNSTTQRNTPVSIHGNPKTFCSISAGTLHSLGIDLRGQVWSWGWNFYGRLGDNSITNRCTPVSLHGTKKTFCSISAGANYSLGIDLRGQVWGWGYNYSGQLGDNSTIDRYTPVRVCNL